MHIDSLGPKRKGTDSRTKQEQQTDLFSPWSVPAQLNSTDTAEISSTLRVGGGPLALLHYCTFPCVSSRRIQQKHDISKALILHHLVPFSAKGFHIIYSDQLLNALAHNLPMLDDVVCPTVSKVQLVFQADLQTGFQLQLPY
jgi:hypothetical protein